MHAPSAKTIMEAAASKSAAAAVRSFLVATAAGVDEMINPAAASATAVHAAYAGNDADNEFPGPITDPDVPRALSVTFGATWDGGDVIVTGMVRGNGASETFASAPGTTVVGSKPFESVSKIEKTAVGVDAATASVGTSAKLGLSHPLAASIVLLTADGVIEAPSALDLDDGTVTPTTAPNGAHDYRVFYPADVA